MDDPRRRLIAELREHALIVGEVVLTGGARAQYYVDAKRAILRPAGFAALGELVLERPALGGHGGGGDDDRSRPGGVRRAGRRRTLRACRPIARSASGRLS
jgi:hypothetical protein